MRYEKEIKSLFLALAVDCKILSVDNGGGKVKVNTMQEAINEAVACDQCHVFIECPDKKIRWMFLVLGNEPGVIVNDYTSYELFDKITEEHYNKFNE